MHFLGNFLYSAEITLSDWHACIYHHKMIKLYFNRDIQGWIHKLFLKQNGHANAQFPGV